MDGDDFISAAYSEYLRDAPEWPNLRNRTCEVTRLSREGPEDVTLFIRECFRLACGRDEKTGYYDFRLRNMMSPKLKQIRIFGKILWIDDRTNAIDLKVYDGTGVIKVYYGKPRVKDNEAEAFGLEQVNKDEDDHEVDAKAHRSKKLIITDNACGPSARNSEPSDTMPDNYNYNCTEGNEVRLREPLKIKGYMTAVGFLTFGLNKKRAESDEQNLWKRNMKPAIVFSANEVEALTEKVYVEKCTALAELFKKRYTRD